MNQTTSVLVQSKQTTIAGHVGCIPESTLFSDNLCDTEAAESRRHHMFFRIHQFQPAKYTLEHFCRCIFGKQANHMDFFGRSDLEPRKNHDAIQRQGVPHSIYILNAAVIGQTDDLDFLLSAYFPQLFDI